MKYLSKIKGYVIRKRYENILSRTPRSFCLNDESVYCKGGSEKHLLLPECFEYKDETWEPVAHLNELLIAAFKHEKTEFKNNDCLLSEKVKMAEYSMEIHTEAIDNNWLCFFYKDELPDCYTFGFDITILTEFKEIQIAFKYKSLSDRLRFMIRDNKLAVFEAVKDGVFVKHIFSRPYYLKKGETYRFTVDVQYNEYRLYINREAVFSVKQTSRLKNSGNRLCLILYQDSDEKEINCTIANCFMKI